MGKNLFPFIEKRIFEFSFLMVLFAFLGFFTIGTGVLDSGSSTGDLVAEYRFEESGGKVLYDLSENDNNGELKNFDFDSDSGWKEGGFGSALRLDGNDDRVEINETSDDVAGLNFSVSVWFKTGSPTGTIFAFNQKDGANRILVYGDSIYDEADGQDRNYNLTTGDNRWHHLVLVHKETDDKNIVYVDGKIAATTPTAATVSSDDQVSIGQEWDSGTPSSFLDGSVDRMKFYSVALNRSDIKSLYSSGSYSTGGSSSSSGKVLEIGFRRKNSTHVFDSSDETNHGEPEGDASQVGATECKVGRCFSFDGSGDHVDIPAIGTGSDDTVTYMTWVKYEDLSSNGKVFSQRDDSTDNTAYELAYVDSNDVLECQFKSDSGNFVDIEISPPSKDEWNHYTCKYNGSHGFIYQNGILKDSRTVPEIRTPDNGSIGSLADATGSFFQGKIDQVKVFNRSLSQREIVEETGKLESPGKLLDLRFDEEGGDIARDSSINDKDGKLEPDETSGPRWVKGVSGNSLRFDGSDDFVNISQVKPEEEVSAVAWIKPEFKSSDSYARLISAGTYQPYNLVVYNHDSSSWEPYMDVTTENSRETSNDPWNSKGPNTFSYGEWHLLAGVYNGSSVSVWLDGELLYSEPLKGSIDSSKYSDATNSYVGARDTDSSGSTSISEFFQGRVDRARVYPYGLSRSDIKEIYSRGSSQVGEKSTKKPEQSASDENLVLQQGFDRVEVCGQSGTLSCPSGVSGEVAVDSSGEGYHGEVAGSPVERVSSNCRTGRCLEFDGSNSEYINISDPPLDGEDEMTISTWVKSDLNDTDAAITGTDWGDNADDGTGIRYDDEGFSGGGDALIKYSVNSTTGGTTAETENFTQTTDWQHIVLRWSSGNIPDLFLDGEEVGYTDSPSSVGGSLAMPKRFIARGLKDNAGSWDGKIDEFRIYNKSLSNEEIWSLYTKGRDRIGRGEMPGPLGWWRFDEFSGQDVVDYSGEGKDGRLGDTDSSETEDPSRVNTSRGPALSFDNNDDRVEIPNADRFDIEEGEAYTLTARVFKDSNEDTDTVFGFRRRNSDFSGYTVRADSDGLFVALDLGGSGAEVQSQYGDFDHENNRWEHLAVVIDNEEDEVLWYIDGEEVGKETFSSSQTAKPPSTAYIGEKMDGGWNFAGELDDLRIYPYALNKEQVKQVMNQGAGSVG